MTNPSAPVRLRDRLAVLLRPSGPLPRPTGRMLAADTLLAAVLCAVTLDFAVDTGAGLVRGAADGIAPLVRTADDGALAASIALTVLSTAPLLLRRRYPLAVLWVCTAAAILTPSDAQRLVFYGCVVAAYSAAAHSHHRFATLVSLPVTVLAVARVGASDAISVAMTRAVPDQYVTVLLLVPLTVAALGLRTWRQRADSVGARMAALERERAEELRRAAEQERTRISRELHDVVTHNVSVMVIQAGAARTVMDTAPDQAREALLAVEAGGRAAMAELRAAMGLLAMGAEADHGGADQGLAPLPDLDRVADLVAGVRSSGRPVEFAVLGVPRAVPPGVGLAGYRVVQEALTNTVKHAVGAAAAVTVEYGADHLRIEVTDTGGAPAVPVVPAAPSGRGLAGLRERLAAHGGTLDAGPRPGGGYRVAARIPLEAAL